MCGIYGFVGNDTERLTRAAHALSHRGPDFAGSFVDGQVALGHRLLSIRDNDVISRQPIERAGSPWVLIFNGQLYNMDAMKRELSSSYANTALDTTILYALIEKHGWDFITHIHGMFAIALYHKTERIIRLYRDQAGQKPIYYTTEGGFAFASEMRGLEELASLPRTIDTEALSVACMLGYIPGTATLLSSVRKVAPSERVTYHLDTRAVTRDTFVSRGEGHFEGSFDDVIQKLITEHLASKSQVALNLSGGLDSSLILHEAMRAGYAIDSYTTAFDIAEGPYNRDAELATRLAADYGTRHTQLHIDANAYKAAFHESYATVEEPNFNISVPIYYLMAQREGVHGDALRVILSGDGGDELFCGYPYYLRNLRDERLMRAFTPALFNMVRNARNHLPGFQFERDTDRWLYYRHFHASYTAQSGTLRDTLEYVRRESATYLDAYRLKDSGLYGSMSMDRLMWLAGENFIRSDKLFMSQSAEMRNPLAYQPFRTYVDRLLTEADYLAPGANKRYLRERYEGKLPDYITKREDKTGWRAPVASWYDPSFKELFLAPVVEAREKSSGLINWARVEEDIRATQDWPGKYLHFYVTLAITSNAQRLTL